MALSKLDNLYRQIILEHNRYPHHRGELAAPTLTKAGTNPSCGDQLTVQLAITDDQIKDVAWQGEGCTISQASTSMMSDLLLGKTVVEAQAACAAFFAMVQGLEADVKVLGDAQILGGVQQFPARIKCATLAWHTVDDALQAWKVDAHG
ncbi:MAG: SUF system NifU family Fe-S cluster assembly protein [Lactobacillaceae bacterium]|jgi:nitrogen fixation NifU-like protein|nr:SUF system NifU family Fe-S cluster assembly protein [Lactobacillaceae bacterium]